MKIRGHARSVLRCLCSAVGLPFSGTGIGALLRFLQPDRWQVVGLVVLSILASLFEAIGVSLIIPVLQALSNQANDAALATGNYFVDLLSRPFAGVPPGKQLQVIAATMLGLILLKNIVTYTLVIAAY